LLPSINERNVHNAYGRTDAGDQGRLLLYNGSGLGTHVRTLSS
jgi:hypothetical protein